MICAIKSPVKVTRKGMGHENDRCTKSFCKSILWSMLHIISFTTVNTTPLLKDLYQHITPQYAADWIVIGTLLGLPSGTLDIIEYDHMHKASPCCNAMLRKWLEMDITASWRKLFTVIESPAVSCTQSYSSPNKGIATLFYVAMYSDYVRDRLIPVYQ